MSDRSRANREIINPPNAIEATMIPISSGLISGSRISFLDERRGDFQSLILRRTEGRFPIGAISNRSFLDERRFPIAHSWTNGGAISNRSFLDAKLSLRSSAVGAAHSSFGGKKPPLVCLNRPVRVAHERPGRRWLDRTAADCYEPFGSEVGHRLSRCPEWIRGHQGPNDKHRRQER